MSGLSAGLSAGGLFGAWFGGLGRVGDRRNRGVGSIPPGALAKFADLGLERFELFFQVGNASVALPATGTHRCSNRSTSRRDARHGRGPKGASFPESPTNEADTRLRKRMLNSVR